MKAIKPHFFSTLLLQTDAGLVERYFGDKPNLPDHVYDRAGPDIRFILKTAFELTCDYYKLPAAGNECLNSVAVHIEDYLASHREFMGHYSGGGSNYHMLNEMTTYLKTLSSKGILTISPAQFMTAFIKKFADANAMSQVFPVKAGIMQTSAQDSMVARMLGLGHILNAMVAETNRMIFPEMHHLKEGRYLYHKQATMFMPWIQQLAWIACMFILIMILKAMLFNIVSRTSHRMAICFIKSSCNTAMFTLYQCLQWLLLPALAHPLPRFSELAPPHPKAIEYVQNRLRSWLPSNNKSRQKLVAILESHEGYIKQEIDTTMGGGSHQCSLITNKSNTTNKKKDVSRKKKYCSQCNQSECAVRTSECTWIQGTGCRKIGYTPAPRRNKK